MSINPTVPHILIAAFLIAWLGGSVMLFWRYRASQRQYLHRFPPVEGVPLDMYWGGGPRTVTRALGQALRQPQRDVQVVEQRKGVWRRYWYFSAWSLGFPTICVAMFVLAELMGLVHLLS
jgi:hypothetical protein